MRKLETYTKAVLIEYIRRLPGEPLGLDELERELVNPSIDIKAAPLCDACGDAGAIVSPDVPGRWCACPAAERLRAKEPDFVERWNERWSRPQNHSLIRRKHRPDVLPRSQ